MWHPVNGSTRVREDLRSSGRRNQVRQNPVHGRRNMASPWRKIFRWIKMVIVLILILGCTPPYYFIWFGWRISTLFLPPKIYAMGDDILYCIFQTYVLFFIEIVNGTQILFHGDAQSIQSKKENVLYISNHQSYMDWIMANLLGSRQASMGHVRFVLKDILQLVPIYGVCNYLHGMIYINRDSFDSGKMLSSLGYLKDENIPSWIVIFPEGTFYDPQSPRDINRSKKYAEDQGLVPFERVLFPRYRGVFLILDSLRDNLDALYDVTLVYSYESEKRTGKRENCCTFSDFFIKGCDAVHIHVTRVPIGELPRQREELKDYLINLFRRKDELLQGYYENMTSLPKDHPLSHGIRSSPRTLLSCAVFLFFVILTVPFVATGAGRTLYLYGSIYGILFGYLWLLASHCLTTLFKKSPLRKTSRTFLQ